MFAGGEYFLCRVQVAVHLSRFPKYQADRGPARSATSLRKREFLMPPSLFKRCVAEMFGTFWLVFAGIGAAIIACNFPGNGIGFIGVALAVGLTVMTMIYAVGHISGGHFNPAVSLGLVAGKRFDAKDLFPYWIA